MQMEDIKMNDLFKAIHLGVREDIEKAVSKIVREMRRMQKRSRSIILPRWKL